MIPIDTERVRGGFVLLCGCITMTLWVLFRFLTKSINFDLIGQQLLARQWLEGGVESSVVGPTNYIFKMLFLYIPAELVDIDQKVFLTVSTVGVSIFTFIGMYFILRKILRLFSIEPDTFFNFAMLWLAAIAGSVFWVQFTNSRNMELLAGLFLLYLGLLLYENISRKIVVLFILTASLVYFSDPLQLFTTSTILVSYVVLHSLVSQKGKRKRSLFILSLVVLGYLVSKLLALAVQEAVGVQLIAVNARPQIIEIFTHLPTVVVETAKNTIRLITGTNEMGVWRQALNVLIVGLLSVLSFITLAVHKTYQERRDLVLFMCLMVFVPIVVYVASGQPLFLSDTSRYLIVIAPALIMFFAVADLRLLPKKIQKVSMPVLILLLAINIGALCVATLQQKNEDYLATSHLEERYGHLENYGYDYGYASMDTALPSMYFLARGKRQVLLPLSCDGGMLRRTVLFYEKSIFTRNEKENVKVPIILDGNAITNYPSVCSADDIKKQIGEPVAVMNEGVNTVLVYNSSQMAVLHF